MRPAQPALQFLLPLLARLALFRQLRKRPLGLLHRVAHLQKRLLRHALLLGQPSVAQQKQAHVQLLESHGAAAGYGLSRLYKAFDDFQGACFIGRVIRLHIIIPECLEYI